MGLVPMLAIRKGFVTKDCKIVGDYKSATMNMSMAKVWMAVFMLCFI